MWQVLNAIFYILLEAVRWRSLPGDFPAWQTLHTYFRNWRKDGTWLKIHDSRKSLGSHRTSTPSKSIRGSKTCRKIMTLAAIAKNKLQAFVVPLEDLPPQG
nr:transposase [Fischerella thermalis]